MINSDGHYEYTGCIHIHTTDSDGAGTHEEVAEAAHQVGLDFILVTDHMTLKSRHQGREGYYKNLLLLIGYEHNDQDDNNHYLLFESEDVLPFNMTAKGYVTEGARQGALGIIAHPDEVRPMDGRFRPYPWTDWTVENFDGIEIWNQMSEWTEKIKPSNSIRMLFSPRKFMQSACEITLKRWDKFNMERKVVGLAGIDVHAFPYKIGPIKITVFPYKVQFKSLRTHLLLKEELSTDVNKARVQVYGAIRDCRLFSSNYRWGSASGFQFYAVQGDEQIISGGRFENHQDATLIVTTPKPAEIRLIHNGRKILSTQGQKLEYKIQSNGLYRIEAYRKGRGWIFSNHIRIGI